MHPTDIDHGAGLGPGEITLSGNPLGDRPISLAHVTEVDGTDIIVPVSRRDPESQVLCLTREQGEQALLILASQIGKEEALALIGKWL